VRSCGGRNKNKRRKKVRREEEIREGMPTNKDVPYKGFPTSGIIRHCVVGQLSGSLEVPRPRHSQQCEDGGPRCSILPFFAELHYLFRWWSCTMCMYGISAEICLVASVVIFVPSSSVVVLSRVVCVSLVLGLQATALINVMKCEVLGFLNFLITNPWIFLGFHNRP
jgi:hypothetical protein